MLSQGASKVNISLVVLDADAVHASSRRRTSTWSRRRRSVERRTASTTSTSIPLGRMLYAGARWRRAASTQGLNLFAAVLLAVMLQSSGLPLPLAEERAFWTFCASLRVLYPADFHRPPFAGLQRLAGQMSALAGQRAGARANLRGRRAAARRDHDHTRGSARRYVGWTRVSTLMRVWDELLLETSPKMAALAPRGPMRHSSQRRRGRPGRAPRGAAAGFCRLLRELVAVDHCHIIRAEPGRDRGLARGDASC